MKKIAWLLILCLLFALVGCGEEEKGENSAGKDGSEAVSEPQAVVAGGPVDVDLSVLSGTVVYAEVYNMTTAPEKYLDKTVRMRGNFSIYEDETTGKKYFACLIADATACCSQGIEFILAGEHSYPADYPKLGEEITVAGVFDTYFENGYQYCQLINAVME